MRLINEDITWTFIKDFPKLQKLMPQWPAAKQFRLIRSNFSRNNEGVQVICNRIIDNMSSFEFKISCKIFRRKNFRVFLGPLMKTISCWFIEMLLYWIKKFKWFFLRQSLITSYCIVFYLTQSHSFRAILRVQALMSYGQFNPNTS